jgi:peroxin-14
LNQIENKTEEEVKPLVNKELIRENMVTTAVSFLLNPRVINSPLTQKRTFLLKKGLSLEEIDLAIDRATRSSQPFIQNNDNNRSIIPLPLSPPSSPSFFIRSTNFMTSVALFGGFLYGAYVFYKKYIEPLLFEDKEPKKHPFVTIQEQLNQLSNAMTLLQTNISAIESNIKKQIEAELQLIKSPQDVTIHELKTELSSIKALLLNRRQFAATPIPSIPLWQMDSNKDSVNKNNKNNIDSNEQMNGSVSNSDLSEENPNSSPELNISNDFNSNGTIEPIDANNVLQD